MREIRQHIEDVEEVPDKGTRVPVIVRDGDPVIPDTPDEEADFLEAHNQWKLGAAGHALGYAPWRRGAPAQPAEKPEHGQGGHHSVLP
jgi:hypothetical protein